LAHLVCAISIKMPDAVSTPVRMDLLAMLSLVASPVVPSGMEDDEEAEVR